MERRTIENRLSSGYKNYRMKGGVMGRKTGFRKSHEVMKEQYCEQIKISNISLQRLKAIIADQQNKYNTKYLLLFDYQLAK